MGLGEIREESIETIGEKIEDVRVDWIPANLRTPVSKYIVAVSA